MSELSEFFGQVAEAVRVRGGTSAPLQPVALAPAILAIQDGLDGALTGLEQAVADQGVT